MGKQGKSAPGIARTKEFFLVEEALGLPAFEGICQGLREELEAIQFSHPDLKLKPTPQSTLLLRLATTTEGFPERSIVAIVEVGQDWDPSDPSEGLPPTLSLTCHVLGDAHLESLVQASLERAGAPGEGQLNELLEACRDLSDSVEWEANLGLFASCGDCNLASTAAGGRRLLQKCRMAKVPGGGVRVECASCGSVNTVVHKEIDASPQDCSVCLCPESPSIKFPCGCRMCVGCFQDHGRVATGEKKLVQSYWDGCWTVPCPEHQEGVRDRSLVHLFDPLTLERFSWFAFLKRAKTLPDVAVCPLSGCDNMPVKYLQTGNLTTCPSCQECFCRSCESDVGECQCPMLSCLSTERPFYLKTFWWFMPKHTNGIKPPVWVVRGERHGEGAMVVGREEEQQGEFPITVSGPNPIGKVQFMVTGDSTVGEIFDGLKVLLPTLPERATTIDLVYLGEVLRPVDTLKEARIYPSKEVVLWVLMHSRPDISKVEKVLRKFVAKKWKAQIAKQEVVAKPCPTCKSKVVHFWGHGCHHIGFASSGCCSSHWCYCCGSPHPCSTGCPMMCNMSCGCPICPTCKPGSPCEICDGCPACRPKMISGGDSPLEMIGGSLRSEAAISIGA